MPPDIHRTIWRYSCFTEVVLEVCSLKVIDRGSGRRILILDGKYMSVELNHQIHLYRQADTRVLVTGADLISLLSILIEVIIAAGAVFIAVKKQKPFGWAIAATFGLYVCFDLSRVGIIPFLSGMDAFLFLAANITMLIAVWLIIQEK